jgi:hypothetical protein
MRGMIAALFLGAHTFRRQRQAFTSEIVDDRQDARPPAIRERVRQKIQALALVWPFGSAVGARVATARLRPNRRRT